MGVSDRMEDGMMDDEAREALDLSKVDLLRMAEHGRPARVAREAPRRVRKKQDLNQRAAAIVAAAVETPGGATFEDAFTIAWSGESEVILEAVTASPKREELPMVIRT